MTEPVSENDPAVMVLLAVEYVLLLLVEPALALFVAVGWLFVRFVWPRVTGVSRPPA